MWHEAMLTPLPAPFPKHHSSAHCRALRHFFWAFCLIFLLGLTPGFSQPLEVLSNCIHLLTTPSLLTQLLIKTTGITLVKTLSKWTNESNGFVYMLSVEFNFFWGSQGVCPLCKTSFYQQLYLKWTDVCSVHNTEIALNHQSFTAPITTSTSLLIGPKITTDTRKTSQTTPLLYYQKLFKDFANSKKKNPKNHSHTSKLNRLTVVTFQKKKIV
jgi:hypothetical protein